MLVLDSLGFRAVTPPTKFIVKNPKSKIPNTAFLHPFPWISLLTVLTLSQWASAPVLICLEIRSARASRATSSFFTSFLCKAKSVGNEIYINRTCKCLLWQLRAWHTSSAKISRVKMVSLNTRLPKHNTSFKCWTSISALGGCRGPKRRRKEAPFLGPC